MLSLVYEFEPLEIYLHGGNGRLATLDGSKIHENDFIFMDAFWSPRAPDIGEINTL